MWTGVIAQLQAAGIGVVAVANPLRGLASDAAYVSGAAAEIDGPVILAGHGYGGAVITAAGSDAANVVGLAYVAAYALDVGESALDVVSGRFPGSRLLPTLRPATSPGINGDPAVELYIDPEAFPNVFAADLPRAVAATGAAAQRPITAAAFADKSRAAAWRKIRCWYVIATADQIIPVEAQRFMALRASADILEIHASHAVAITQPEAVAGQIAAATRALRAKRQG
jgi:pimeloyl-ACP methyl ester carboxylesterase